MWKDILKNQINVPGLSMRPMDLTNIIDEENDDDCFDDLERLMKNVEENMTVIDGQKELKYNFKDMMTNQEACELYNALTTIPKDKFTSSVTDAYLGESYNTIIYKTAGSFKIALTVWWPGELLFRTYDENKKAGKGFNFMMRNATFIKEMVDAFYELWGDMK